MIINFLDEGNFMKKALVAYHSSSGNTEAMAKYLAEGVRITGSEVEIEKVVNLKKEDYLSAFNAYIFGCPTYHKDITRGMKQFLFLAKKANLAGKVGGSFGSHTHSGESAPMIFDNMEYVLKMNVIKLGPLSLTEDKVRQDEGIKACHEYAKALCQMCQKN